VCVNAAVEINVLDYNVAVRSVNGVLLCGPLGLPLSSRQIADCLQ